MSLPTEQLTELFDQAFTEHSDTMFRFFVLRISDRQTALDLTQETFARFWATLSKGEVVQNSRAFLFTIAGNLAKNHLRDRKHNSSLETLSEDGFDVSDATQDTSEFATTEQLKRIFKTLSPEDTLLLTLRYIENIPVTEIARALGSSRVGVSVRLHRLTKKLKPYFDIL